VSITAQYFAAKAAVFMAADMRREVFSHILSLDYARIDEAGAGTLLTRMTSDVNQVQNGVNMFLRLFMRSPFIVFGSVLFGFLVNPRCGLILLIAVPLLGAVVFGIMKVTRPHYKKVQENLDTVTLKTKESLEGVRVIRAFGREADEEEGFRASNAALAKSQRLAGSISAALNPLTIAIVNLILILILRDGQLQIAAGSLTQGGVIALTNYLSQILIEMVKLSNLIILITRAFACAGRVEDVMKLENKIAYGSSEIDAEKSGVPAVSFSNVSMRYEGGGDESLAGISFKAMKGQTVGVIGGTGSGKSTLISLIPRFYDADDGTIELFGNDIRSLTKETLNSHVAVVPQKAQLFSGTIRSNLMLGSENVSDEALMRAVRTAQAEEVVAKKAGGLDAIVEQGGRNFSGGQKQRLTIARALVKDPDILILDDSASALDMATDAALRKAIKDLPGDMTVFIVSQRTSAVMDADFIIVLEDGRAAGIGTHGQLLENCPLYKDIYDSQFGGEKEAEA